MRQALSILLFLVAFTACHRIPAPDFLNLDFEQEIGETGIPYSWSYTNGKGYNLQLVKEAKGNGKCLSIYSEKNDTDSLPGVDSLWVGGFSGELPIELVKGRQVEIRARIKTKALTRYSGLFIVDEQGDSLMVSTTPREECVRGTRDWQTVSLQTFVEPDVTSFRFGGRMEGRGTVWFDNFEIRIDKVKLSDAKPRFREPTEEELQWLQTVSFPMQTVDPDIRDTEDLRLLDELIGEARLVGLGSGPYGSGEICRMKARITRYLFEHKAFTRLLTDASRANAERINEYVKEKSDKESRPIPTLESWQWQDTEAHDLFKWLKAYQSPSTPVHISGFGTGAYIWEFEEIAKTFYEYSMPLDIVTNLFRNIFFHMEGRYFRRTVFFTPPMQTENIPRLLTSVESVVANVLPDGAERESSLQKLQVIRQTLERNKNKTGQYQIENYQWLEERLPDEKEILWTHNEYIRKTKPALGSLLIDNPDKEYLSIGFAIHNGTYSAIGDRGTTSYKAQESYPGTYEYVFQKLNEPILLIDLRKVRQDTSPEGEWLRDRLLFRKTAVDKTTTEFSPTRLTEDFDLLIFINTSSASRRYIR